MEVRALLGVTAAAVVASEVVAARVEPTRAVLVVLLALAGIVSLLARRRPRLLWIALAVGGSALGTARMRGVIAPVLPVCHVARLTLPLRTSLSGRVVAAPERRGDRTVLLLEATSIGPRRNARNACGLVRLVVRGTTQGGRRRWRYGDRLRLDTVLRAPRNFENPGRFDYVGHLARSGVRVTAFAWDEREITRRHGCVAGVRARLERWRARLRKRMAAAVPASEAAVLQALVVGEDDGVPDDLREAFTRAGVVHVLSVSGLHIALVAAAGFLGGRWLLTRSERLLLALDVDGVAALLSLVPVGVYTALAGGGVATVRSAVMGATAALAVLLGRRADVLRLLALAAIVLALVWPGAPLEIAFQLSFASVLALVLGARRLSLPDSRPGRIAAALAASPCALLGTAPLTAFHFHQVSLVGVLANAVVIPIFGSLVVGLGLIGALVEPLAPELAVLLFQVAGLVLRPGIALVRRFAEPWWAAFDVPTPDLLELFLLYALLLGLVVRVRRIGRLVTALALVGLLGDVAWWTRVRFAGSELRVAFLDVGQGDAAVAELPGGRVIVIDGGGFPGSDFDTGAAIVSPYLRARKIARIDALVMTHAHPDHSNGLRHLLANHRPREFWWTGVPGDGRSWEQLWGAVAASGARVRVLADGMPVEPDEVAVLHPPRDWADASLNDSSLTLRIAFDATAVLATGDIEQRAEERLLAFPDRLRAAVLKVPHHGSRTSSTPRFVAAVDPAIAVISVGADNRYGLPAPEVEERYRARGTCVLRTDRCGARRRVPAAGVRAHDVRLRKAPPSGRARETVAERVHHEPDTVPHPELLEDIRQVRLHGALADRERVTDLLVLVAGGDQPHDLELPLGETVVVVSRDVAALGPEVRELLDQGAGHAWIDPDLAGAHGMDRLHQGLAGRVLQDDALRPELEGPHVLFLLVACRQHEHLRAGADAQHGRDGVEAAALRHADVEEQDVGSGLPYELDDVLGALGVRHHLDILFHLEDGAETLAEEGMVIDDHDTALRVGESHAYILRSTVRCRVLPGAGIVSWISEPCPALLQTLKAPPRAAVRSRIDHGAAAGDRKPSASTGSRSLRKPRPLSRTMR